MSEEDAALFWEVDPDPNPTEQRESMDLAPYLEKAAPVEGVSPETARLPAPATTHRTHTVECSSVKAAPSDTAAPC